MVKKVGECKNLISVTCVQTFCKVFSKICIDKNKGAVDYTNYVPSAKSDKITKFQNKEKHEKILN